MAKIRGVGIESIRRVVRHQGKEFEEKLLARVSPEQAKDYRTILTVGWSDLPEKAEGTVLGEAAKMLFPTHDEPLFKLGKTMAMDFLPFMYKVFFSIPSVNTIFSHATTFWERFYDTGRMVQENVGKNSFDLVLYDFPNLPRYLLEFYEGYYQGIGELCRVKTLRVTADASHPHAWRWHIDWE